MLELVWEHDYVTISASDWVADRSDDHSEAQEAFDAFCEAHADDAPRDHFPQTYAYRMTQDLLLQAWLTSLGDVTGLYGEDGPWSMFTGNGESFLSTELSITLAHTEQFGSLLCVAYSGTYGDADASVEIRTFTGDDDSDAADFSGGYAVCSHDGCDYSDKGESWILESACTLNTNGAWEGIKLWDLSKDDDDKPLCPACKTGTLTFWTN